eukprot:Gb_18724 [translate_table: standard]
MPISLLHEVAWEHNSRSSWHIQTYGEGSNSRRWASRGRPFSPWLSGYFLRLGMAAITTLLIAAFPTGSTLRDAPLFYFAIVLAGITTSFASTLMFVSQDGQCFWGVPSASQPRSKIETEGGSIHLPFRFSSSPV